MTPALVTLLTLLLAFPSKLHLATATVLDTDGNWVRSGGDYYVLPSFNGSSGGGLTLARTGRDRESSCPLAVVQSASEACLGIPVSISSHDTKIILTNLNVNISFAPNFSSNCTESFTWILVKDDSAKVWSIGIGSNEDYPSNLTMAGWFKIEEYYSGYKFVFCSSSFNSSFYEDVGIYTDIDGNNRLALQEAAFAVKFKNADSDLHAYD